MPPTGLRKLTSIRVTSTTSVTNTFVVPSLGSMLSPLTDHSLESYEQAVLGLDDDSYVDMDCTE